MRPSPHPTFVLAAAGAFAVAPVSAQESPGLAGPFRLLPAEREVALARSAAPPSVSDHATVWVLEPGGFRQVVEGTNGVSCMVSRDHPESLYPICYDREASRTILPIEIWEVHRRMEGMAESAIAAEVEARLDDGRFAAPTRGALTWMMSPDQVLFAGADGPRVGPWHPHAMIYIPGATAEELGVSGLTPSGDFQVALAGTPRAHLIIQTVTWADGTPHAR